MHKHIHLPEFLRSFLKHGLDFLVARHVALLHEAGLDRFRQRANSALEGFGSIGKCQARPAGVHGLRDPPCDGVLVRHAENEGRFAFE